MLDLHCHTLFSFDSNELIDNYLKQTDIFIQTDHQEPMENHIFDVKSYKKEIQKYTDSVILTGVEIGYDLNYQKEIQQYIDENDFDVVLLSHHHSIKSGSYEDIEEYLSLYVKMINEVKGFDVLTHFDFPFRYKRITLAEFKEHEATICMFLEALITKELYLELNTMSIYHHKNKEFYEYVIKLYDNLGGKKYSIGSDAHRISDYKYHFDDVLSLLDNVSEYELLNNIIENKHL